MNAKFAGKTVVVAGGGSGIGRAAAALFSTEGATVVVVDRVGHAATETVSSLSRLASALTCDISSEAEVRCLADEIGRRFGRMDVFVSTVAVFLMKSCLEADAGDWHTVLGANVTGAALSVRYLVPLLPASGGAIVLVNSASGKRAEPAYATYSTSKAALLMLARSMAVDLAPRHVRVNTVSPGPVDTPALRRELQRSGMEWAAFERSIGERQAVPRVVQPEDVARAIAFLASEDAGMITGADLTVDGGYSLLA